VGGIVKVNQSLEFGPLYRTLRRVTNQLVDEIRAPTAATPDWSDFDWVVARSASAMQGISGLLANRLRWREPREFIQFLQDQREHTAVFCDRARALLARIDHEARKVGVPFVGLKGAGAFNLALHGHGERPMSDLDLLVQGSHFDSMLEVMAACGYTHSHTSTRHAIYKPASTTTFHAYAEHRDNPLRVELHTHVSEALPFREVDVTSTIWSADPQPGVNAYPSRASLLRHLLMHAAGNMRAHALRALQAFDNAALAATLDTDDWEELLDDARAATWWLYPPLVLSANVRAGCIPEWVLTRAARATPPWLRSRARGYSIFELSWSNLQISAFPGIEWARTPLEALRFARTRVLPSRRAVAEMRESATSMPRLLQLPWYQMSHRQRMIRWILGRAPRVQTMTSVMAACAEVDLPNP
jgi:hypothetical protein